MTIFEYFDDETQKACGKLEETDQSYKNDDNLCISSKKQVKQHINQLALL